LFVLDTSAYLSGWRHHLRPRNFPGVWTLLEAAFDDGRIMSPRAVYTELQEKDDDVYAWVRPRAALFVDATPEVQRAAGVIQQELPHNPLRNVADPWVIAEAQAREWTVVTYEGQTFSGVPTTRWHRSMPGICQHYSVACATLPDAIDGLGGVFA
jgi:uncharacterized protein DUF4411